MSNYQFSLNRFHNITGNCFLQNNNSELFKILTGKYSSNFVYRALFLTAVILFTISYNSIAQSNKLLWRLGKADNSPSEFANYITANPEIVAVPADWSTRTTWNFMSKGLKASVNPAMNITYTLPFVPKNGVFLSFKLLDADRMVPEMAVFSNSMMAGMLQLYGTQNTVSPYEWKKTYKLYIPKELLVVGNNILRLEASRQSWSNAEILPFLTWEWDYLSLESLALPATEPLHGKMTYMSTNTNNGSNDFYINEKTLSVAPNMYKWLGVAYCQNTTRVPFWSNEAWRQTKRLEYLQLLQSLNMTVVGNNYVTHKHWENLDLNADGTLKSSAKATLDDYFAKYGSYITHYEIDNEPGLFDRSFAANLAIAKYVNSIKPAHVKLTAPGWAYWPTLGGPDGWELNPEYRREIENLCEATNGHSYGSSYTLNPQNGGVRSASFPENLLTYGGVSDGWTKEYVNTEMGTNDTHTDFSDAYSTSPHASIFDRIVRAHISVVDRFVHHAALFEDGNPEYNYTMFKTPEDFFAPNTVEAHPGVNGEDTRVKTFRRLALAYSTHGAPLKYEYLNKTVVAGKRVYFRGVNTATLGTSPSGGTSKKLLLSFVNFEAVQQTMNVRVTLPSCGTVSGERIGASNKFSDALSTVNLTTNSVGAVDIAVTLGPLESVQYILDPPSGVCTVVEDPDPNQTGDIQAPSTPSNATGSNLNTNSPTLTWAASTDNVGVVGYDVYEGQNLVASLGSGITSYSITGLIQAATYNYTIKARDAAGNTSSPSAVVVVKTPTTAKSDLVITNLSWSPANPTAGQAVSLRVTVKNQGGGATLSGTTLGVSFKVDGSQVGWSDIYTESLAPGKSVVLVVNNGPTGSNTWTPSIADTVNISATVDDVNRFLEDNESNNSASASLIIRPTETEIVSITAPISKSNFEVDSPVTISANTTNGGVSKVEFFANGTKVGEDLSSPYSITWTPGTVGAYGITAKSTFTNGSKESSAVVIFIIPLRPDLIITDLRWTPSTPGAGTTIRFSGVVKNQGKVATPEGTVIGLSFFIKRKGSNTNQTYSDTYRKSIAPGESVVLTANGGGPNKDGTYTTQTPFASDTLFAHVDDINRIAESNDGNNTTTEYVGVSSGAGSDIGAPSVPEGLASTSKTSTSVNLTWSASTDDTGVTGYDVFVNGVSAGTSTSTTYSATGLTCNMAYSFTVRAKDLAGNVSAQSSAISVITNACTSTLRDPENPANTTAGLEYKYYEGSWNALPVFGSLTPVKSGNATGFDLSLRNINDNFAFSFTGFVSIPADGIYTFYTSSDDGSKLYIGTTQVVNNDGLHGIIEKSGSIGLKAGKHAITVTFFEKTGSESLVVSYSSATIAKTAIPASALFRAATGFGGDYSIIAKHSNKAMEVVNASLVNAANVQQKTYTGATNQIWTVEAVGTYYKLTAKHSGQVLDVAGGVSATGNAANIQQYPYAGADNQLFSIEVVADGFYRIIAKHSGKAVDVSGPSPADGANIHQWTYGGWDNQLWKFNTISTSTARIESLEAEERNNSISIYPMPVTGNELNLNYYSDLEQKLKLDFTSMDGHTFKSLAQSVNKGMNSFSISVADLKNGIYLLRVQSSGKMIVKKVIITK